MEEDRSDDLLVGTPGYDKFQKWVTKNTKKVTNRLKKDWEKGWEAVKNAELTPEAQAQQDELLRNPLKGALNTFMDLPEQAAQREEQAGQALHDVTGGRVPKFAGALLVGMLDPFTPPGGKAPISAARNALRLKSLSNATELLVDTTLNRVGIARRYADNKAFINKLDKINRDVIDQGLENYKGPRSVKAPDGKTYKIETSGKTGELKTSWRNQEVAQKAADWRVETEKLLTPDASIRSRANAKMRQLKKKGLDGHHIIPLKVSRELMESMTPKQWAARVAADAKKNMFHGHDPRNIVGAKRSNKVPHKPTDLWHRTGTPDSPGYHALEKQVDWRRDDLTIFRDQMVQQVKPRRQAKYRQKLALTKKTKPTQFPDNIQRHIQRSQEIGIPEPQWKSGSIDYTWRPQSGTGQIDIPPQSAKGFKGLRDEFFKQIEELPSGSVWELNPKFKDEKRRRIYARLFGKDKRITRNPDPTLGWVLKVP